MYMKKYSNRKKSKKYNKKYKKYNKKTKKYRGGGLSLEASFLDNDKYTRKQCPPHKFKANEWVTGY